MAIYHFGWFKMVVLWVGFECQFFNILGGLKWFSHGD
jgi:hypothetical protein